jgi:hypothetical protein
MSKLGASIPELRRVPTSQAAATRRTPNCQTNVWLAYEENKMRLSSKIRLFNNLAEDARGVASFDSYLASM